MPWLNLVFSQFNPLGLFFGLVGARALLSEAPRLLATIIASAVVLTAYSITYNTVDYQVLMLPVFLLLSVLVGAGVFWMLSVWLLPMLHGDKVVVGRLAFSYDRVVIGAAVVAFAIVPGSAIVLNYGSQDLSSDRTAYNHATSVIAMVPDGFPVLSNHDSLVKSLCRSN